MSKIPPSIADHYTSETLWDRLHAALLSDGVDPLRPSLTELAPYDHFHGRGLEATQAIADRLKVARGDRILDVGCGLGGPARLLADAFGCQVTGIDLTREFCEVAVRLNELLGLDERISIEQGDALAMPFAEQSFDGAYSMNVSMNIEDKAALFSELHRVLKPRGWLMLSELARGSAGEVQYPTPWAQTAASSFLATSQQTRATLEQCGFDVEWMEDTIAESAAYGLRSRELVARGEKPLHRAVTLIHGEVAKTAMANSALAVQQGRIIPVEIYCVRRSG